MTTATTIPWWHPVIGDEERAAVLRVLDTNYLNEGDVTTTFEQQAAALFGARHAVATTSGTSAIFLALAALGIGHGDEVIVPDVTFIATANAVVLTGATPILVDVDPATLNINPAAIEPMLTPRTRAIVPVHVSGRAAAMDDILSLAGQHGVAVVEDAAEALLSHHQGRCLGTFGIAGCFSFSPNKTITTGQGGLVVTDDDALMVRLRELKDHGRPVRGTGGNDVHATLGFNFKLTNLQAAVGVAQLPKLATRGALEGSVTLVPRSPAGCRSSAAAAVRCGKRRDAAVDRRARRRPGRARRAPPAARHALPPVLVPDPHAATVRAVLNRLSRQLGADAASGVAAVRPVADGS